MRLQVASQLFLRIYRCRPVWVLGALLGANIVCAQPRIVSWGIVDSVTNIPAGLTDIKAVAAGGSHCLVLRSNGLVVAWGDNSNGQTNVPLGLSSVMAIAAGGDYSLALRSNGTVAAWGSNQATNVPAGLSSLKAIAAGGSHGLALRSNGTVVAWGDNTSSKTNVPPGLAGVAAISAGDVHSLVLKSNGTLAAWGDNASGQLNFPVSLTNIMAIAAGYHHNLVVRSNGTVAAWELNVDGEGAVPPGLSNVVAVAAGYFYSMALKSDGTVVAWGDPSSTNVPQGLTNVVMISTPVSGFGEYSLALTPSPVCPPGFPDNFECRSLLSGTNVSLSIDNTGATAEPGEPSHFGFQDVGASLWYTWTAPFSGGAVISANSSFPTPCLAVYTGNSFETFASLASNNTAFYQSRVVFNAIAGTHYQIAVDGTTFGGSPGVGAINVNLTLTAPPANDLFASRTPISGPFFETSGSFIGATQEPGEPAHTNNAGNPAFKQTLWWTWAGPTNLGVSAIRVKLIAEGVSFPPNIGVYTGTSVSALTPVSLVAQTNGMTRIAGFTALPGTNYQIALGGEQYYAVGVNASPRYGNYTLRLNIRALVLSFGNISPTNNGDDSVSFGADLQVTNFGSSASNPLRARVTAHSGVSVLGQDTGFVTNGEILVLTTNLAALAPGQGVVRRIAGVVPPPTVSPGFSPTNGVGYGAYAELQEEVDTNWFSVDETLILFGTWPDLNGNQGPGGGVIRLDPSVTGAGFNPLSAVNVLGPLSVQEGSSTQYSGRAAYASGYQYSFSNTVWAVTAFSITTNGIFTAGSVTANTPATVDAAYSSGGFQYDARTNITILNLPPPTLTQVKLSTNQNFSFQVQGVANRKHVVEAAVALTNPIVWVPLGTNSLPSGFWNFSEFITNHFQRFYRAREAP